MNGCWPHVDTIATILVIGAVCGLALWLLEVDGKDIALAGVSGLVGFMTRGGIQKYAP